MEQRTLGRTGFKVSPVALGTTEIGFVYGIGPRTVSTEEETEALLKRMVELGVNFIDTAHFYGLAEERIGRSGVAKKDGVIVATKCGHILDRAEAIEPKILEEEIRKEVEESRRKLDLATLPLVMFHGGSKEQIESGLLVEIMQKLKDEGKVLYAGISTRGEEPPLAAIQTGFFDVLQLGHSILDQRMASRVFPAAQEANLGVVNRSVFLKGALTPAVKYLSPELNPLKEGSARAEEIARGLGIGLPALAVRFALSNPAVSTVLIGTNKLSHLESAVAAAEAGPLPKDVLAELSKLAIDDVSQVDPAHWPPAAVSDQKGGKKIMPHFYKESK